MAKPTEVAVVEKNEVAVVDQGFDNGLGELSIEDMIIPRLKIDKNNGDLKLNISDDVATEMNVAVIRISKSRILWPAEYDKDNDPLCKSNNFTTPDTSIEKPMCDSCGMLPLEPGQKRAKHKCEYANWTMNKKNENVPPACSEVWNVLLVDLDTYTPMIFSVAGNKLSPTKKILSTINIRTSAKRIPACSFSFKLTSTLVSKPKGDIHIPVYSDLAQLPDDQASDMKIIMENMRDIQLSGGDVDEEGFAGPAATKESDEDF